MARYNEDDIYRETYGGPPKGWSSKEISSTPEKAPSWSKPARVQSSSGDAQFTVGLGAPGLATPQTQSESFPTE